MHRLDVENALGLPTAVDPALAADGVSEVLDTLIGLRVAEGTLSLRTR